MTAQSEGDRPTPKVNDQYWFDWSKAVLSTSIRQRDKAAAKLQNLAVWLWGIYTASAAVGFSLSGKDLSIASTLLIALGSAGIISVYCASAWVQSPKFTEFDPRAPDEIRSAYSQILVSKQGQSRRQCRLQEREASKEYDQRDEHRYRAYAAERQC